MRAFLEKYGEAIFVIVILNVMILLATPLGANVRSGINDRLSELFGVTKQTQCEHEFIIEQEVDSSCTENGYILYCCKFCEDTREERLLKVDHTYELISETPSTCSSYGLNKYKCSECNFEMSISTTKQPHKFKNFTQVSDHNSIYYDYICEVCGETDMVLVKGTDDGVDQ